MGGAINSEASLRSALACVTAARPHWFAAAFLESDFCGEAGPDLGDVGHDVLRHWPGPGSRAFLLVVNRRYAKMWRRTEFRGRSAAVAFEQGVPGRRLWAYWVVFWHGAHDAEHLDSAADAAALARLRPPGYVPVVLGDFNADLLPTMLIDPWARLPGRAAHHREEREHVDAIASAAGAQIIVPVLSDTPPLDDNAPLEFVGVPFSRLPRGRQVGRPAVLDYALAPATLSIDLTLHWRGAPADHGLVCATLPRSSWTPRPPTSWYCRCLPDALAWATARCPPCFAEPGTFTDFVRSFQDEWADTRGSAERKRSDGPLPLAVRDLWARAPGSAQPVALQRLAWRQLKAHFVTERRRRDLGLIASRRPFRKKACLHTLRELMPAAGGPATTEPKEWEREVSKHFGRLWRAGAPEHWDRVLCASFASEALPLPFSDEDVRDIALGARRPHRRDRSGIAPAAVAILLVAAPGAVAGAIRAFGERTAWARQLVIEGAAFGKEGARAPAAKLRCILPVPSVVRPLDALLARCVHRCVDSLFPAPPGVCVSARPGLQGLDLAHGVALALEKAQDRRSRGGAAQQDIDKFYDMNVPLLCCSCLARGGLEASVAGAALRLQSLPAVVINIGRAAARVERRTRGSITGSRLAVALGRVPVESVLAELAPFLSPLGFTMSDGVPLTVGCYVDNLVAVANDAASATSMLDLVAAELSATWGLNIKKGSRMAVHCRGSPWEGEGSERWPVVDPFPFLGYLVSGGGGLDEEFALCRRKVLGAFFRTAGSRRGRALPPAARLAAMDAQCLPVLDFFASRWPPSGRTAVRTDDLQAQLLRAAVPVPRQHGESCEGFWRRRARAARARARERGPWSVRIASRVAAWDAHLRRGHAASSWASRLRSEQDGSWVRAARLAAGSLALGGRTGTRAMPGRPPLRWHDAAEAAREIVARWGGR